MFSNYFKTAFRSLWRKKSFTVLNVIGLAVGIAASLLIFLVISNELGYDGYHTNKNRIYRVVGTLQNSSNGEITDHMSAVPIPFHDAFRQDFPAFEKSASIANLGQGQIYVPGKDLSDEKRFKENDGMFFSEPEIFSIFDYTWLVGNATALTEPNTAVINETLANKYFTDYKQAVGKTVQLWSFRIPLRIVGVFKDLPGNTDIPVRLAASFATLRTFMPHIFTDKDAWTYGNGGQCFALLKEGQQIAPQQAQLPSFVKKYYPPTQANAKRALAFQPLKDVHLNKDFYTFKNDALAVKELWALGLIGLFLLLVACINFINLATAQSVNRAKEIGVRKVLGSGRGQLMRQFLTETGLITVVALLLGCLLAQVSLPLLSDLMQKTLSPQFLLSPATLLFLLAAAVLVTLLAGFYPALVVSGFQPIMALKSKVSAKSVGGISLRRGLVVLQFAIAQLLVIGTLVVVKQMKYFRDSSMGFDKAGVLFVDLPSDSSLKVKYPVLKTRMLEIPGISDASFCMDPPSDFGAHGTSFYFDNDPLKKDFDITFKLADTSFYKLFGVKIVEGRMPFASDTVRELLLNETAAKKLGFKNPHDILGKMMGFDEGGMRYPVVGVIKDFNSKSLREQIAPLVISSQFSSYNLLALKVNMANMSTALPQVQKLFSEIYPTYMYDPYFFDEKIQRFYQSEEVTAQLFKVFAFLAIFLSCLGLYGLVSFMAVQKTKEVGIRKVLGASVQNIVYLFSKEFTLLILIAFLIAAPIGYYFMNGWLSGFYYHTDFGWIIFVAAIGLSVAIAWITVSYKAVKAALANPVKSLKTE